MMDSVLKALLGAGILGALFAQIATWLREHWGRKRERNGLLRILYTELSIHQRTIEAVHEALEHFENTLQASATDSLVYEADYLIRGHKDLLKTMEGTAWQETRLGLAQALTSEEFAILALYYQNLEAAKGFVFQNMSPEEIHNILNFMTNRLRELLDDADQLIHDRVPDVKPSIVPLTREELEE